MTSILITGATSGLGEALTLEASKNGFEVIACGRNENKLAELAKLDNVTTARFDASDEAATFSVLKDISCDIHFRNDHFELIVTDQGIGIPIEDQQHLFTRFFRASNVTNIQGTGVGLNIVRRYVDLLNGSITFESVHEKGTTFTVTLPCNSKADQ